MVNYQFKNNSSIQLHDVMTQKKLSLRGLARLIALSPSMLSRMINCKRKFRVEHKKRIALVLETNWKDIQWPDK
tara:strand:- start:493 stop:714 length:222 start_codon:yes stop_codon:yes gene_type:complete